jgi:hypothetical protein
LGRNRRRTPGRGEATAELLENDTIEIEFACHNGDEAILNAKRVPSSTAC